MEPEDKIPHINVDFFEDLTGEIDRSKGEEKEEIGGRVRNLRVEKGLTLEALSHLTGFEVEFLSRIEENRIHPQLGTIIKLSRALDAAFGRLVSGVGSRLYTVTRKNERKTVHRSTSRKGEKNVYAFKSLAPEVKGRHMEPLVVLLEENSEDEASVHEGEEFIFVLEGKVAVRLGEDRFVLEPGDSVYYLSTTPHTIAAASEGATILAVLYAAG